MFNYIIWKFSCHLYNAIIWIFLLFLIHWVKLNLVAVLLYLYICGMIYTDHMLLSIVKVVNLRAFHLYFVNFIAYHLCLSISYRSVYMYTLYGWICYIHNTCILFYKFPDCILTILQHYANLWYLVKGYVQRQLQCNCVRRSEDLYNRMLCDQSATIVETETSLFPRSAWICLLSNAHASFICWFWQGID